MYRKVKNKRRIEKQIDQLNQAHQTKQNVQKKNNKLNKKQHAKSNIILNKTTKHLKTVKQCY